MGKKILVCDDDASITEMIKVMLESDGCEVKILSSGKAIVKQVKEYMPKLILLDIWMPGIDGEEVTMLLKKDLQTKDIPIIIISALGENEISTMVKKVGADGFLSKPFEMQDLFKLVNKYTL